MILLGILFGGLGSPAGPGGDPDVQPGSAVPAGDPSGGVQRLQPGRASFGPQGILSGEEVDGTRKVLKAAALTYVAAAAGSILQLLRLVILFGGRDRDND